MDRTHRFSDRGAYPRDSNPCGSSHLRVLPRSRDWPPLTYRDSRGHDSRERSATHETQGLRPRVISFRSSMVEHMLIRNLKCLGAIAAAVVCTAAVSSSQQPSSPPAGTARIAGFVFDDTNDRPLEGIEVRLSGAANPRTPFEATTKVDNKGHFEFAKVPDGRYSVLVGGARGYSGSCYGLVGNSRDCGVLAVGVDDVKDDLNFRLSRGAIIHGVVRNENGEPLSRMPVHASIRDSSGVMVDVHFASTNDEGEYEFSYVPPGRFILDVTLGALFPESLSAFYPGTLELEKAEFVEVGVGDEVRADIRIPNVETYALQVKPATVTGDSISKFEATLVETGGWGTPRDGEVAADMSATFTNFDAGQYVLHGRGRVGNQTLVAWQLLNVPEDLKPLTLVLKPTGTIRGRLIPERGGIKFIDAIMVVPLFVVDGEEARSWDLKGFRVAIDGSFVIDGLYGTQRLRVDGLPSGWKVRSIMRGRTNVEAGIDVESGETIDVVITIGQQ